MSLQYVLIVPSSVQYVKSLSPHEAGGVNIVVKGIEVTNSDAEADADADVIDEIPATALYEVDILRWPPATRLDL